MKTKSILACLLVAVMITALAGCNSQQPASGTSAAAGSSQGTVASTLDSGEPDYDSMTMEELYELAIKETGTITIYSTTTGAQTAVKKFLKDYPEFEGRIEYIESDTKTVANRITTETDTGNYNADVLQVKDNSGELFYELVAYDYLDIYYPASVCAHVDPDLLTYGMPVYATYSPWYYNTNMYPDGCPLTSWWDIVQGYNTETRSFKDANGNNTQFWTIYTKDITSASYAALWAQIIVDGDLMTEQYEKQYGEKLEFTYHDSLNNTAGIMEFPENNGGVELFWRFTQMVSTELDDGDQVVSGVDLSLNGPTLGLCSGSKLSNVNNGVAINWVTGLEPYTAFRACDYLYVVKGSDNPAGARLFILYELGGDDGESGCLSVFNTIGKWSIRDDIVFDKTPYTDEEVNLKSPDFEDIYGQYPNVKAYWIYWQNMRT